MNVKLLKNLFVALVAAISISSCSSANDCAMASDEGVAKIKELIKAHVDINECKIYRIEWKEDWKERKLENVLSQISVDYIDKEDNDYNLTINYTDGEFVPEEPRKGKSVLNSYEYTTAIEIDGMNAEKIRHNIASGGELVILQEEGKQYEFKSVENICCICVLSPKITKTAGRNGVMTTNRSIGNCARCSSSILLKKTNPRRPEENTFGRTTTPCRLKLTKPVKLR